ncbi:hypothetical protein EWB00_008889 [Schistosoma japonicum]|uniref:Uncharacterized protein n=1 Tax=Schistosoma japonicum TaxID=6182 RepID=A0A4Z2DSJ2_SCHJA|nr:hypothetical protein EWB00_008889 [Schistosoma japonicum]
MLTRIQGLMFCSHDVLWVDIHRINIAMIKFLFPFLLLIVNVICSENSEESSILSDEDKKQLEKLKGTSEFQLAKEKVLSVLSDKIDNYVLEQLRQTN